MRNILLMVLSYVCLTLFSQELLATPCDGTDPYCPATPKNTRTWGNNGNNYFPTDLITDSHYPYGSNDAAVVAGCAQITAKTFTDSECSPPITGKHIITSYDKCATSHIDTFSPTTGELTASQIGFEKKVMNECDGTTTLYEGSRYNLFFLTKSTVSTTYICDNPAYPLGWFSISGLVGPQCARPCKCNEKNLSADGQPPHCVVFSQPGLLWKDSTTVTYSQYSKFTETVNGQQCFTDYKQELGQCDGKGKTVGCASGQERHSETLYSDISGLRFNTTYHSSAPNKAAVAWVASESSGHTVVLDTSGFQIVRVDEGNGVKRLFAGVKGQPLTSYQRKDGNVKFNGTALQFNKDIITRNYSAQGLLQNTTTNGVTTSSHGYDGSGRLHTIANTFNRQIVIDYDDITNKMKTLTDPAGRITRLTFVGDNLTRIMYPDDTPADDSDNTFKTFHYEDARFPNALTGITDENGKRFVTYHYDDQGRVDEEHLAGNADKLEFWYNNDHTTTVNRHSNATTYHGTEYTFTPVKGADTITVDHQNPCYSVLRNSDCVTGTETRELYSDGLLKQLTERNGSITTYDYDHVRGLETTRTEAYGTVDARTITTEWHPDFDKPSIITEPKRKITFGYYTNGLLQTRTETDLVTLKTRTSTYTWTAQAQLWTVDGPRTDVNDVTTYGYDAVTGDLRTVTDALQRVTKLDNYDSNGRVQTITDANNVVTELTYWPRGWLKTRKVNNKLTQFFYDNVGQLTKVILPSNAWIGYEYDDAHRLTAIKDNASNRIEYTLDWLGNRTLTQFKNPAGTVRFKQSAEYNALGQLVTAINANGKVTDFTHYADDLTKTESDALGHANTNTYDNLQRLNNVLDAGNGNTTLHYDSEDTLDSVQDAKTKTTSYAPNAFGESETLTSPNTNTSTDTYDEAGNLLSHTDARGTNGASTYTYDELNRLKTVQYPSAPVQNMTFTYDSTTAGNKGIGRLTGVNDMSGTAGYVYNADGLMTKDTRNIGGTAYPLLYSYDNTYRIKTLTLPSGDIITWTRDGYGRVTAASLTQNGVVKSLLSNGTYRPFGPMQSFTYGNGLAVTRTFDLNYRWTRQQVGSVFDQTLAYTDDSNIDFITDNLDSSRSQDFGYDPMHRLNDASGSYGHYSWLYDSIGNRSTETLNSVSTTYTYFANTDRLKTLSGAQTQSYAYTQAGSLSTRGDVTFTYFANGRINGLKRNNVVFANYKYNAKGERVLKTVDGVTTHYLYDQQGRIVAEYNATTSALIKEYIWLDNELLAVVDQGNVYYAVNDHLGTTQALMDAAGAIVWRGNYSPFGASVPTGTVTFNLRFPGQYFDAESGLHYNYFRDYDPQIGRYVESDPIGLKGGINTYAYAGENPASYVDPLGLDVGEPGTAESFIPVWGSGRESINDFETGHPVWGTVNGVMAVSDVFLIKSLATGLCKGVWKAGAHGWKATRAWYGRTRGLTKGTPVHHWLFEQNSKIGKNLPDWLKNQPWNLMPMEDRAFHDAVHGWGPNAFNMGERAWYGTPDWMKVLLLDTYGKSADALRGDDCDCNN